MSLSQEQINSLTLRFQELEWIWLNSFPQAIQRQLAQSNDDEDYDPTALTHYGEFFLTLSGIKPCFLIANSDYPAFGYELVKHVLSILLPECIGFEVFRTADSSGSSSSPSTPTSAHSSGSPGSPLSPAASPAGSPRSARRADVFIFTSRSHPKFPLIAEIILKPHTHSTISAELLAKALGYPTPSGEYTISYIDRTTSEELGMEVVVFEYPARKGYEVGVNMHFKKCAEQFKRLGRVLQICCN